MKYEIWRENPDDDVPSMIQPYVSEVVVVTSTDAFHVLELTEIDAQSIETAIENELLPAITDFATLEGPNFDHPVG